MNKIVLSAQDLLEDSFRLGLRVLEDAAQAHGAHSCVRQADRSENAGASASGKASGAESFTNESSSNQLISGFY